MCFFCMDRFFVVGSRDMIGRIFLFFFVLNFFLVILFGYRNIVIGCFFEENLLDVFLLELNLGCKFIICGGDIIIVLCIC